MNIDMSKLKEVIQDATENFITHVLYDEIEFVDPHYEVFEKDNNIVVEVRCELGYESMSDLGNYLNQFVEQIDPRSYFEAQTEGIIQAYIRKDQSDDIVDEEEVSKWANRINECSNEDELIALYKQFKDYTDSITYGTLDKIADVFFDTYDTLQKGEN